MARVDDLFRSTRSSGWNARPAPLLPRGSVVVLLVTAQRAARFGDAGGCAAPGAGLAARSQRAGDVLAAEVRASRLATCHVTPPGATSPRVLVPNVLRSRTRARSTITSREPTPRTASGSPAIAHRYDDPMTVRSRCRAWQEAEGRSAPSKAFQAFIERHPACGGFDVVSPTRCDHPGLASMTATASSMPAGVLFAWANVTGAAPR